MAELTPFSLKDAPALIEAVFPAQKVSFEAQKERSSGSSQTLTSIGMYWKGRKPLILVRAITLGCLLPQTDDIEKDLKVFEMLMSLDDDGLSRRAFAAKIIKPAEFAKSIELQNPWQFFAHNIKPDNTAYEKINSLKFPCCPESYGISVRWRKDVEESQKISIYKKYIISLNSYDEKSALCKRPEQLDQDWLYKEIWEKVNKHYTHLGISVNSHQELVEQLGILRFGRRPVVSDTFSGGGSIPFEAARLGCDVNASDLNPIACSLTWGALNIIGATETRRKYIENNLLNLANSIDNDILELGIEHDNAGNRAKAYLYCLEVRCPETGWRVPLSPDWIISKSRRTIAKLIPDWEEKRFKIEVCENVSEGEFLEASKGTFIKGGLSYELNGKKYTTPIKTLRGDYKDSDGVIRNNLRLWSRSDFKPRSDDVFQERLYAIQWIKKETLNQHRKEVFFSSVRPEDEEREIEIDRIVTNNLSAWQAKGLVPDMEIEPGLKTDEPIKTRGWTHWHHLFNARGLLTLKLIREKVDKDSWPVLFDSINHCSKLCYWATSGKRYSKANPSQQTGGASDNSVSVFVTQALNTFYNHSQRAFSMLRDEFESSYKNNIPITSNTSVQTLNASQVAVVNDLYITDPPYADAVVYHEITEFFIAWMRKGPPKPLDDFNWDSRRALAVKGSGNTFRKGMVGAYKAMADHMPDNGMQCVMFTHQDTGVWSDMVGIFWAAGLQVVGAWYIATETTSELKKGGYVQGTVILMLRKRPAGENAGFKQRLLPAVRAEVKNQIETMMHLNDEVKDKMGEPVFNDSDLQMAGYAAALKVLTSYTHIGGEDVTTFALRPRAKGEVTVVDEIVQQAAEAANSLLVPDGLSTDTWQKLSGIQRFYLRMMDIETTGAAKLDNYQNFAKAFRVEDYSRVMGSMAANKAQLKRIPEFASRDLTESNEIGSTWLGHLIIGLQQLLAEAEPQAIISQLQADLPDFMEVRALLIDMLKFIENKAPEKETRDAAEVLGARLKNMRALGN